jgi:uncharacterized Zn finger protein
LGKHAPQLITYDRLHAVTASDIIGRAEELLHQAEFIHRLVDGNRISALFHKGSVTFSVAIDCRTYGMTASCGCSSMMSMCKHATALALAYLREPETFFDLEHFLDNLPNHSKADLVRIIRRVIGKHPEALTALGIEGFQEPIDDPDEGVEDVDDFFDEYIEDTIEEELFTRFMQAEFEDDLIN